MRKSYQFQKGLTRFVMRHSVAMNYFKQMSISSKSLKIAPAWVLSNGTLCIFIFEIGTGCVNQKCSMYMYLYKKIYKKIRQIDYQVTSSNVKTYFWKKFHMEHPVQSVPCANLLLGLKFQPY